MGFKKSIILFFLIFYFSGFAFAQQGVLKTISLENEPVQIAINTKLNKIYITHKDNDLVTVIDGNTDEIETTFNVNGSPNGLAVL